MILIPALIVSIECLLGVIGLQRPKVRWPRPPKKPIIAIVIPAHNEGSVLTHSIQSIQPELTEGDSLIVVADNCDDDTASVARRNAAIVWERNDPASRGKGYALNFAIEQFRLQNTPPDIVIFIDADCRVAPGAIERLAGEALAVDGPVQAAYEMHLTASAGYHQKIAYLAWTIKTYTHGYGVKRNKQTGFSRLLSSYISLLSR